MSKYFVLSNMESNQLVLARLDLIDAKENNLDLQKHKLIKVFNDELEARNYFELFKQDMDREI
jgi:hypothetical protein